MKREFKLFLEYCNLDKRLKRDTVNSYRKVLNGFREFLIENFDGIDSVEKVDKNHIRQYLYYQKEKYKPSTAAGNLRVVRAFFHYLLFEEIIEDTPFRKVRLSFKRKVSLPKVLTVDELQYILNEAYRNIEENEYRPLRFYIDAVAIALILELMISTGARISEVVTLKRKDIDLEARTIRVKGKTDKTRLMYLSHYDVVDLMAYYLNIQEVFEPNHRVFLDKKVGYICKKKVSRMIKVFSQGLKKSVHPHMFRHSFATLLVEADVDLIYVKELLGHENLSTTEIYLHTSNEKSREVLEKHNPRDKMHPYKTLIKKELDKLIVE